MAQDLYVDSGEMAGRAMEITRVSRRLGSYAANLSALITRVYESGALVSDPTKVALDEVSTQLREASNALVAVTGGIDGLANSFLADIEAIDRYE